MVVNGDVEISDLLNIYGKAKLEGTYACNQAGFEDTVWFDCQTNDVFIVSMWLTFQQNLHKHVSLGPQWCSH